MSAVEDFGWEEPYVLESELVDCGRVSRLIFDLQHAKVAVSQMQETVEEEDDSTEMIWRIYGEPTFVQPEPDPEEDCYEHCMDEPIDWLVSFRLSRRFRADGDIVRLHNDTDTKVCFMCTQDLVSVLRNGGVGVNAGPAGVEVRADVAKELVKAKEIKSYLTLAPKESQDVRIASKYVVISAFALRGEAMTLLYSNIILKRGYKHTAEQKDIDNALTERELEQLNAFAFE
ncbi:hypothetical protein BGZ89_000159 [Linnemannia elongata]|nr:hypothetical protein BGZ89_000159 [Linnemannia elongata]